MCIACYKVYLLCWNHNECTPFPITHIAVNKHIIQYSREGGGVDFDSDELVIGTDDVMKLKNTFTPPTTGPAQLLELVLVAAALQ